MKMNLRILNILVLLFALLSFTMIFTQDVKAKFEEYSVFAKVPLIGEVKIQSIETNFTITNNDFDYSYNVEPSKLVDFFDDKVSNGYIRGEIKNQKVIPKIYFYHSQKNDSQRSIEFNYLNGKIIDIRIEPDYDTSKITNVTSEMIRESIDPVTMFYFITNYDYIKNCNFTMNIYDGKRRYDLILSDPIQNKQAFNCTITHQKIAGYKLEKIKENKKYITDLKFIIDSNGKYIFKEVSLKENNLDLIIKRN